MVDDRRGSTQVLASDRVAFIGRTGSGKTYLARSMLSRINRLVVLDPKGSLGGSDWNLSLWENPEDATLEAPEFRVRVRTPVDGNWDPYIWRIMDLRNVTLYVDEVYGVIEGTRLSDAMRAVITRGREQGIGVWSSTQRPASIPLVFISEADWFFVFQLRLEDDKRRMSSFLGPMAFRTLKNHNVIVYNDHWDEPRAYRQINAAPMSNVPSYQRGL